MARVLFLTQVLPYPLDAGPKVRAYYVLRTLAASHAVTLVSFVRKEDSREAIAHLAEICEAVHTVPMERSRWRDVRAVLRALLSHESIVILRDEIGAMQRALERIANAQRWDVIHADQTSMAQYALYAREAIMDKSRCRAVKTVVDVHNALFRVPEQFAAASASGLRRLILHREARLMAQYERRAYARFDRVVFVSDADRRALGFDQSSGHEAETIPICVDPDEAHMVPWRPEAQLITHLGTMFWPPNIEGVLWFIQKVLPLVLEEAPAAKLILIGRRPPKALLKVAQQEPAVQVMGYVPDPATLLAQTAAFIVPLRSGAGMRVKILDAWRWGVPVVSTSLGAEGICARDGEHLLLADEPRAFAQAVLQLLAQPETRARLRANAREWVSARYDWRTTYSRWDAEYEKLLRT